jgi:hypothetical protein
LKEAKLTEVARNHNVSIKVDKSRGITLEGNPDDLVAVNEAIFRIVMDVKQQEFEKREHKLLAEKVNGFAVA